MSKKYLFPKDGNWYKANLHSHSTMSDGHLTPEEAKEVYKSRGYQIYAYSDHRTLVPHTELKDENFLPITSIECNIDDRRAPDNDEPQTYHLNFYSKKEDCAEFPDFPHAEYEARGEYSVDIINDLIARANKAGFLAQYNHPHWSTQTIRDFGPLEGLWGFEVFNGCHTHLRNGWGAVQFVEMMWDGKYLCPTGGDDNHNKHPMDSPNCESFTSFTMIKADKLEYNAVLNAMENGNLYASTGPLIEELYIEDTKAYIKTSPVCKIIMRTQYRAGLHESSFTDDITEATFDLSGLKKVRYIRFEVWDSRNQLAMTRAFFPEEWQ